MAGRRLRGKPGRLMDGCLAGISCTKGDQVAVQSEPLGRRRSGLRDWRGGECSPSWLRELLLTPWCKTSAFLPQRACSMWDFHQVWTGEAQPRKSTNLVQLVQFVRIHTARILPLLHKTALLQKSLFVRLCSRLRHTSVLIWTPFRFFIF